MNSLSEICRRQFYPVSRRTEGEKKKIYGLAVQKVDDDYRGPRGFASESAAKQKRQ